MNKYLEKAAQLLSKETKNDLVTTGTLGAVGGAEALGMHKVFSHPRISHLSGAAKFGLGTGVTLAADYAAVRLGKSINAARDKAADLTKNIG